MEENLNKSVEDLLKSGFTVVKSFFSKEKINIIRNEIQTGFKDDGMNLEKVLIGAGDKEKNERFYYEKAYNSEFKFRGPALGRSKVVDSFFKQLFENDKFIKLCELLVGKNFKIYNISFRELGHSSKYLGLHQDNYQHITFQIPLTDISKGDSSTYFVKGSHLCKFSLLDELFAITQKLPNFFFEFCTKKFESEIGDLGIFFNKTFHGTTIKKKGAEKSLAIHVGLYAEGGYRHFPYKPFSKTCYNEDVKTAFGEKLFRYMFSKEDLIKIQDDFYTYLKGANQNTETVKIGSTSTGRVVVCLKGTQLKEKKNIVDRIIFEKFKLPLSTTLVIFYFKTIIKSKNIIKKFKNFIPFRTVSKN